MSAGLRRERLAYKSATMKDIEIRLNKKNPREVQCQQKIRKLKIRILIYGTDSLSLLFVILFFLSFRWSHRLVAPADKFGAPPSSFYYLTLARGMCYARAGCFDSGL